jgi:hypothetical protein
MPLPNQCGGSRSLFVSLSLQTLSKTLFCPVMCISQPLLLWAQSGDPPMMERCPACLGGRNCLTARLHLSGVTCHLSASDYAKLPETYTAGKQLCVWTSDMKALDIWPSPSKIYWAGGWGDQEAEQAASISALKNWGCLHSQLSHALSSL